MRSGEETTQWQTGTRTSWYKRYLFASFAMTVGGGFFSFGILVDTRFEVIGEEQSGRLDQQDCRHATALKAPIKALEPLEPMTPKSGEEMGNSDLCNVYWYKWSAN